MQDKGRTILFEHLGPRQHSPKTYVSMNSLTYAAPHLAKRQVQQELWSGHKAIDLKVTQKQPPAGDLTMEKTSTWAEHATAERLSKYCTTARSTQLQAALRSDPRKRDCKAAAANVTIEADSGYQQPTTGRKVVGEMCGWVDRKERCINILEARKPINYTVKLSVKDAVTGALH
jgi:hypothetical protein